jgi:hypothetical protein
MAQGQGFAGMTPEKRKAAAKKGGQKSGANRASTSSRGAAGSTGAARGGQHNPLGNS